MLNLISKTKVKNKETKKIETKTFEVKTTEKFEHPIKENNRN